jgi:glutamate:Na+ symporter, ESS family
MLIRLIVKLTCYSACLAANNMLHLDLIQTLAFAGLALLVGYGLCRVLPLLSRYNLPPAVVGGLAVAVALSILRHWDIVPLSFDNALQKPLMSAFFTSIGFQVSAALLRRGGLAMLLFLLLGTIGAVLQNIVGMALALSLGQPALFGVLCGSLTLAGGPATGVAFAPQFESAGIQGAEAVAIVSAICGIVAGGLLGAPIATVLIERMQRRGPRDSAPNPDTFGAATPTSRPDTVVIVRAEPDAGAYAMHKSFVVLLFAMCIGSWLSAWLTDHNVTLPGYIGGMLAAAAIRNIDDATGWFRLSQRWLDVIGNIALSFFLAMALMTIELWKLADIAWPMTVILSVQMLLMVAYSVWPVFFAMGRNYDAAVTAGGFFGFMIGITANALASMDVVVRRYGPAPMAYLVVPVVGAFFIDFTNALLIQSCLNMFK